MTFVETTLKQSFVINLSPITDQRGFFVRLFCKDEFKEIGFNKEIAQINHAVNKCKYTFRGFHYQIPPFGETKLIRCVRGKVQDYIIDIRKNSPTFLESFSFELSESNPQMILVPEGFAHGYITMEDNAVLVYFHTAIYKPGYDRGLRFNDPALNINLLVEPEVVSERDLNFPLIEKTSFEGLEI